MENKKNRFVIFWKTIFARFVEDFKVFWYNVNDPKQIRKADRWKKRRVSVRGRLEEVFLSMMASLAVALFCCYGYYSVDTLQEKIAFLLLGTVSLATVVLLSEYRHAIAESRTARIHFERGITSMLDCVRSDLVRICVSVFRFAIVVVTASVILQYIPNIDQHIPYVAYAADQIVELFNELTAKAVEYVQSYVA